MSPTFKNSDQVSTKFKQFTIKKQMSKSNILSPSESQDGYLRHSNTNDKMDAMLLTTPPRN